MTATHPIVFDEFFDSNLEDSVSPFLTPESRGWGRNLPLRASIASAVLLLGAFLLSLADSFGPLSQILLLFVYLIAGVPKLIDSINDILSLEINIDVLMTLAAFLSVLIGSEMEGALLLVLFAISGSLEEAVTGRARSAIRSLHRLSPTRAVVVEENGRLHERALQDIGVGTWILVKSGEIVPLDGEVIEGTSSVDLSHLTGENLPLRKGKGESVPAGARNLEGALTLRVTHTSSDSTLARIIKLVTQAQDAKPRFQRWLDRISRGYAITIISLTFLFMLILPWIMSVPFLGIEGSIYRSLAFLIAASPCALIIALPIAYLSAISSCARNGILLKGGVTLDALYHCGAIAFDKTGTLTLGELACVAVEPIPALRNFDPNRALAVAAGLERNAVHPIAHAVASYCEQHAIQPQKLRDFHSIPGYGLEAYALFPEGESYVYIGHPEHIAERLSDEQKEQLESRAEAARQQGQLISALLIGKELALLRFRDTKRPGVAEALARLKKRWGLRLMMLTGDHHANAEAVAREVGIDEFYADLKPEDKLAQVGKLSEQIGLAMVGDGINDGPALARATTGISMGRVGSRTAIDASDIVLLQDRLDKLDWLWEKAARTQSVVKQNVALATVVIIGASLAALLGFVPLWLAVILHEGGTVIVGLNSLRLLR